MSDIYWYYSHCFDYVQEIMSTLEELILAVEADLTQANADLAQATAKLAQAERDSRPNIGYICSLTDKETALNNRVTTLTAELIRLRSSLLGKSQ